jgi:hypothetical protein
VAWLFVQSLNQVTSRPLHEPYENQTAQQPNEFGEIIDNHQSNWVGQWRNEWQSQKLCRIRYRAGG